MAILGVVEGLACPWEYKSFAWLGQPGFDHSQMEMIASSAFDEFFDSPTDVRALISHTHSARLGSERDGNLRVWRDDGGLMFRLEIPDSTTGREARRQLDAGELCGASIGFRLIDYRWEPSGRPDSSKIKVITQARLNEISLTGRPAYHATKSNFRWMPAPSIVLSPIEETPPIRSAVSVPRRCIVDDAIETTTLRPGGVGRSENPRYERGRMQAQRGLLNYLLSLETPDSRISDYGTSRARLELEEAILM